MSYMKPFSSIVTLCKRNNVFYGKTESSKIRSSFTEISTDLNTIYNEVQSIKDNIEVLASGFLLSGSESSLYDLRREVYNLEEKISRRIYIQANQVQILE
jgi:hypothetical protein